MTDEARYTTDDCDIDPDVTELVIFPGGNGDWYVGTAPQGQNPRRAVRITTSGTRVHGLAVAIAKAYRAIVAAGARAVLPRDRVEVKHTKSPAERFATFEAALSRINGIRNSIVGAQNVNWSEHIYPLVRILNEAGFEGMGYEEARSSVGTLIERTEAAKAKVEELLIDLAAMRAVTGPPCPRCGYYLKAEHALAVPGHYRDPKNDYYYNTHRDRACGITVADLLASHPEIAREMGIAA